MFSEGNDLHRICEGYDLHWICEGNDLAAAISVGVTTVVLRRGRLVKRAYDALLLDAGGTLLQLVKPVEEIYASIGRKYEEEISEELMMLVDYGGSIFPIIAHSPWNSVHLANFVMPFFLFIAGVSLALGYKSFRQRRCYTESMA
ncbi:unnamed protein product [Camellia sinensis]